MAKTKGSPVVKEPGREAVRRVHDMIEKGHDVSLIKKDLKKEGYSEEIIEDLLHMPKVEEKLEEGVKEKKADTKDRPSKDASFFSDQLLRPKERPKRSIEYRDMSFGEKLFILLFSLCLVIFLVWLSIRTGAGPSVIFVSFVPTFITIIASLAFFQTESTRYKFAVWAVPLLACAAFYGAVYSMRVPMLQDVEVANVTVLNFVISMLYVLILDVFKQVDNAIMVPMKKRIEADERAMSRKTTKRSSYKETDNSQAIVVHGKAGIKSYLQSIEDKAKALNFVIGRVYSNKHGGTPALRDKIKINKDWYNMFADVNEDNMDHRLPELRDLVFTIGERLNVMWRAERVVFGPAAVHKLKDIDHETEGNDKVIDVMIRNDKDPVETYYKTAVEFCNRAVKEIDSLKR